MIQNFLFVVVLSVEDYAKLLQQLKKVLEEQLTGISINQNQLYRGKTNI